MSTDANVPVTTSQLGRLNPIDFESSGKVKNRPITSALQAFEIYQRFERDNLLRANKNKDLSDAYNGSPPFDQTKLNNVGQRWRANWSRNMLASVVNRVKNRFIASINGRKYLTASKLPNSFPNGASKSELYQEAITKLLRQWTGFRDFLDKLIQEDVLFGYTGSFHLSDTDWRPRTARQEELLMDEQTPQCADQLPIFVVKMDYYLWEITNMIEDRGAAEDEGFQIDNLEWACRMAYPPRMNLAYDPRQLSDMVREANIYYTYHKSTNVVQTAYVFVTNFTGGVDCWWVNRSQAIGQRLHEEEDKKQEMARGETREGSRDTEDDADDPEDREGILLRYTEDFARNMQDVITLFTLESGNNRYFGSKGLGRYLYNPTYAQDRVFCLAQDKIYAESLIWGKIDSANVARMGMEVRNPFGVFPDGFEPSKDHQFDFDPAGYQFLIAQCQALIDMFAGTYLPDAYGETGIVQQDPTATEVKIEASKEEETSQGILERHACQFALLVGCCQRRVACKENLQAALAFIRAQEEAVKKKKILVPEQEYELITSIDTPENKAYLAEPDLGQADREAVNMLINLIQKGLTIPEIIVISRQPALAYTDNIGAKEDAKFVQFYPVAKNNPNFDQNKLDQEMAVSMIGPDRASEIFIPNPQATTQLEAGRQQLGEIGTMMTTPIPVPVSPRDDHLTHIATGQQWLNKSIGQMKQRAEDKTNPAGVLQIGDQMLGTTARIMQHIDGHIQQLLQQGSTEQAILQQMKTARANKNDMKVVMDHYQKAQQLAQQMQQQMAQMRAQAQAGQNGQNSGPFPELSQPMPQHAIPNESLPTPETPQHAAALPSGTHFMSPEGTRRVRP